MSEETEKAAARCEFELRCPPGLVPTLTPEEVNHILDNSKRARLWAADTPLSFGEVVVANGHRYFVTAAGTTGATAPTFLTGLDDTFLDNDVRFKEAGAAYGLYDVEAAIRAGWAAKLAKSSEYVNSEDGNETVIFDHCLKMMEAYDAPMVA